MYLISMFLYTSRTLLISSISVISGFNEKTGWMHTTTGTDVIDEFIENVEKSNDVITYKYGKENRIVEEIDILLNFKKGDSKQEKIFTIYRTLFFL